MTSTPSSGNPINNLVSGIRFFFQGIAIIFSADVKKFVIMPLIINLVLFSAAIYLLATQYESLISWLTPELPAWLPSFITSLLEWFIGLLWVLFSAVALIIIFFGFTIIANIVGAPFNTYLAAAIEFKLTGVQSIDPRTGFFKILVESVSGEIKKLVYFLIWMIPLLIITVIPVINVVSPFLWAIFSAWMLSLQYVDYPLGNRGFNFSKIRYTLSQHRILSLGFGGSATLATMIPILNFLVMPVSVAGATIMTVKALTDSNSNTEVEDQPDDEVTGKGPRII